MQHVDDVTEIRRRGIVRPASHLDGAVRTRHYSRNAGLAQLVEHLICNQEVVGSSPTPGTSLVKLYLTKDEVAQRCRARRCETLG